MAKILKNTTGGDISILDTGITVPASGQYTIPQQDYLLWAASTNITTHINSGAIVVNDTVTDLSIARALDYIKYPDKALNIRFLSEPERSNSFLSKNVQEAIEETKALIEGKVSVLPTFLNNGATNNKWLALDGSMSGSNDLPAITSFDSRLASLTFMNNTNGAGVDLEFYRNGTLVYTWQIRNKRYAWKTSNLSTITFTRGDRISVFARGVGGQTNPQSVIVFVNVQTVNSAQDEGGQPTLGY